MLAHIRQSFPSTVRAALLVVTGPPEQASRGQTALARLERSLWRAASRIRRSPPAAAPTAPSTVVALPLTGAGDNAASRQRRRDPANELSRRRSAGIPGVETAVTGVHRRGRRLHGQISTGRRT